MARKIISEPELEPEGNIEDILALEGSPARRENTSVRDIEELQYYKKLFEDIYKDFQELGI